MHVELDVYLFFLRYEFENGVPVPKTVSLVDMANYCWHSPANDLSYFFFMSLEPEMRSNFEVS
jgi:hypothetical protein